MILTYSGVGGIGYYNVIETENRRGRLPGGPVKPGAKRKNPFWFEEDFA
jgi:hypothetical protein